MSIRGWFVWEELMTTDKTSAARFYGKVAGLKTQAASFDPKYTTFLGSAGTMGGLMALPDEAKAGGTPPSWISYIGTPNADETARQAAALGGKIAKAPWDIADGGRIAILQDPQGAIFAIYSNPKTTDAPPSHVALGHASWHELATTDYNAAFGFYQKLFGWQFVNDMDMPGTGTYRLFAPNGTRDGVGGIYNKPAGQPGPPTWLPYLKVANVAAATKTAKSLGAKILHGPAEVPGGMITMAADPQGVMFALHQSSAMPAAAAPAKPKKAAPPKKKAKKKAAPKRKKAASKKKTAKKTKRRAGAKK